MTKLPPEFDLSSVPDSLRAYFEAKMNGTLREYFSEELTHLRDDFLDDLPTEDVRTLATLDEHGRFVGDNYKCRGNYIFMLAGTLQSVVTDGVVTNPKVIERIKQFRGFDWSFQKGERTTPSEIEMINQILASVIGSLE